VKTYNDPLYTADQGSQHKMVDAKSMAIQIVPDEVWQSHLKLNEYVDTVAQEITTMGNEWAHMHIRWQGPDANEAKDFVDNRLTPALEGLFGPEKIKSIEDLKPGQGALVKLSAGVNMAAHNYAQAEAQVSKMLAEFADALSAPPSGGGGAPPGSLTQGPLTETT